jgi:hypothetical protein
VQPLASFSLGIPIFVFTSSPISIFGLIYLDLE